MAEPTRKSIVRLAVLQLLHEGERYGYEMVEEARLRTGGALALAEGNLYPALHALEAEGHLAATWREVEDAPPRKYYRLTPSGARLRLALLAEWTAHVAAVERLIHGDVTHADDARSERPAGERPARRPGGGRRPRHAT